jgi:hypothetical protein
MLAAISESDKAGRAMAEARLIHYDPQAGEVTAFCRQLFRD